MRIARKHSVGRRTGCGTALVVHGQGQGLSRGLAEVFLIRWVLCLTSGDAQYADMGHFGARPIRIAWISLAMPALVLCYFGHGARMLADPSAVANPFFALVQIGTQIDL